MKPPPVLVPTRPAPADPPAMTSASLPYLLRTTALLLRRQTKLGRHSSQLDWLLDRATELRAFVADLEAPHPGLDAETVAKLKAIGPDLDAAIRSVASVDRELNQQLVPRLERLAFELW